MIFHARRDLGTLQTYVACGARGAGTTVTANELLRVPAISISAMPRTARTQSRCTLEQATAFRDALVGADIVLDVWRSCFGDLIGSVIAVDHSVDATRTSSGGAACRRRRSWRATRSSSSTPVCGARTLAEGRPAGDRRAQQDFSRVYPLADDPERCVEDFLRRGGGARAGLGRTARSPGGVRGPVPGVERPDSAG